jgi:ribosomal protein L35
MEKHRFANKNNKNIRAVRNTQFKQTGEGKRL